MKYSISLIQKAALAATATAVLFLLILCSSRLPVYQEAMKGTQLPPATEVSGSIGVFGSLSNSRRMRTDRGSETAVVHQVARHQSLPFFCKLLPRCILSHFKVIWSQSKYQIPFPSSLTGDSREGGVPGEVSAPWCFTETPSTW